MATFDATINERIRQARRELEEARLEGDDFLVHVRLGELESLTRVAADHGIEVDLREVDLRDAV